MNLKTHIRSTLWQAIANTYETENYSHAVLDAIHYLSEILREKSGVDGDGAALVGQALGGNSPRLRVNKLQTETERNVQRGLEDILRGLYRGIRNPRSHEQIEDAKDTADAIIYFVNYLLSILDQSQEPFTISSFCERVFDPDFVASARYAELLVSEIPPAKLIDTLIEIYRRKREGDGRKLNHMVKAIVQQIPEDQLADFAVVVSDELKTTREDRDVRLTLQIFPPDLWPRIDEAARLRVENKIIKSISEGEFDFFAERISGGALGTWASNFFKHFTEKFKLWRVFLSKLEGDDISQRAYIVRYYMYALPTVFDAAYNRDACIKALIVAVRADEPGMKDGLAGACCTYPEDWRNEIREGLGDLEESDPDFYARLGKDEIPF